MLKSCLAQSFFKRHILAIGHNFNHHIDVFRAPNFRKFGIIDQQAKHRPADECKRNLQRL